MIYGKESDYYYTPYYAVTPILKYIPKDKIIWCPFDEEFSAFYQSFKQNGYKVIRSHITEGRNFFTCQPETYDIIVSNPPFSMKDKILRRLYELNKPFAILQPLNSLQGIKRYQYFKQGIQILAFDQRIEFHDINHKSVTVGHNPTAIVYFCRDILPKDLIIERLIKYKKSL